MTVSDVVPSVKLERSPAAELLAGAIQEALQLLVGAGRVRLAGAGERADLVHTVGDVGGSRSAAASAPWVHTVDRIPLRGRELTATRSWVRRERRRAARCTMVLTHGRTAGRLVVEAALAPGERVFCMPVLSPWQCLVGDPVAERARLRRALGIAPGVRLVVGVECAVAAQAPGDWASAIERLGRSDVRVLRVRSGETAPLPADAHRWGALPLTGVLGAADLFVATGHDLAAHSPGVSALAMGLPVLAVTTDSVAELVTSGRNGNVVAPRADAIAAAVAAHLDAAPPLGRVGVPVAGRSAAGRMATGLLGVYQQALAAHGPSGRWVR